MLESPIKSSRKLIEKYICIHNNGVFNFPPMKQYMVENLNFTQ